MKFFGVGSSSSSMRSAGPTYPDAVDGSTTPNQQDCLLHSSVLARQHHQQYVHRPRLAPVAGLGGSGGIAVYQRHAHGHLARILVTPVLASNSAHFSANIP